MFPQFRGEGFKMDEIMELYSFKETSNISFCCEFLCYYVFLMTEKVVSSI